MGDEAPQRRRRKNQSTTTTTYVDDVKWLSSPLFSLPSYWYHSNKYHFLLLYFSFFLFRTRNADVGMKLNTNRKKRRKVYSVSFFSSLSVTLQLLTCKRIKKKVKQTRQHSSPSALSFASRLLKRVPYLSNTKALHRLFGLETTTGRSSTPTWRSCPQSVPGFFIFWF